MRWCLLGARRDEYRLLDMAEKLAMEQDIVSSWSSPLIELHGVSGLNANCDSCTC